MGHVTDSNWEAPVIGSIEGFLAVAAAQFAVAFPALRVLKHLFTLGYQCFAVRRALGWQCHYQVILDRIKFGVIKFDSEGLDVVDHGPTFIFAQPVFN